MSNSIVQRLLDTAKPIWDGYHSHPFVRGIADGTLSTERFRFYLLQDYLYLFDYARVFALGVVKSSVPDDMLLFASYVHQILDGEMDIHKAYMARLGITKAEAEAVVPSLANHSYTAYMKSVALEEGPAEIATVILSCAVSYEHIAKQIVREHPHAADHPFYGEWIRGYADASYAAANRELCSLVEQLSGAYSESQKQHLCELFLTCSRYEAMFWDMAWEMAL